jgi:hypothetical protein
MPGRAVPNNRDQHQDLGKHLPRHRDLGHLERDVAAMADHLGADLDQLLAQADSGRSRYSLRERNHGEARWRALLGRRSIIPARTD